MKISNKISDIFILQKTREYSKNYDCQRHFFEKGRHWGLCTNHVDRIWGIFDPPPPFVDTFTK